ncbi:MAG: GIY-YIG nuclease family protein [Christiangramia sp.]|nr:GIY-YIG nuclease family protein [Christiangramia sp.]
MEEFVNYVLFSKKFNKIYIGFTSALIQRFYSHNYLSRKGYTLKFRAMECGFGRISQYKKRSYKQRKISEIWTRKSVYQNTNFAALQMSGRFICALGGPEFSRSIGIGLATK